MSRIPSLDGLRAIAIAMVCLSHLSYLKEAPVPHLGNLGTLGVRVFFVISGLLITHLLLEEQNRNGRISLKHFYARRTLRIFPAMWVYTAVIGSLSAVGAIALMRHDILHALTYSMNYFPLRSWSLAHMWSLSIEEQFYVLWPVVVALATRRAALRTAFAAIALAPAVRLAVLVFAPQAPYHAWFPAACDSLAMGCILPLMTSSRRRQFRTFFLERPWFAAVPPLVILINAMRSRLEGVFLDTLTNRVEFFLLDTIGITAMNFGIAAVIERAIARPGDLFGRVLNSRPLVWLGKRSYSLYLWQMPFLNHEISVWITRLPLNLVGAISAAALSYRYIETPFLKLRARFSPIEEKRSKATVVGAAVPFA